MAKEYKHWKKEKKLIPVMIKMYCKGNHKEKRKDEHVKRNGVCSSCQKLTQYALFRLEKCPFKKDKGFCSYCKIHCYLPEYRQEISKVMRYSGPRMIFTHPIFACSHVVGVIKHKREKGKKHD